MDLLKFDLPDDDGTVTVKTRTQDEAKPDTMAEALDWPVGRFRFWHACGSRMELISRSERKTVLFCRNCGNATTVPPWEKIGTLIHWILYHHLPCQFALELTHTEFEQWAFPKPAP